MDNHFEAKDMIPMDINTSIPIERNRYYIFRNILHKLLSSCIFLLFAFGIYSCIIVMEKGMFSGRTPSSIKKYRENLKKLPFPNELIKYGKYNISDLRNKENIVPPYWDDILVQFENISKPTYTLWGPCYPPRREFHVNNYDNSNIITPKFIKYPIYHPNDLTNLCLPGFLIIGAGKCGTSSLYYYLVGHPRVLPAKKKQIHYFKYYSDRPFAWYLTNFPTTESFLSLGALMTGEASPGYMPYPTVAHRISLWINKIKPSSSPTKKSKIISIVRHPLQRAWSSYNYNYVQPALTKLRKGRIHDIPRGQRDEFYQSYLFTFEDLIQAELSILQHCLQSGEVANQTYKIFRGKEWSNVLFRDRSQNLPSLIYLELCYGKQVSRTVPRIQWSQLLHEKPNHIINVPNLHLVQSLIGRGLYSIPLEWWYTLVPNENLYMICNEDLKQHPLKVMTDLTAFLGLPEFNYTPVVSAGRYNVHGHIGYDVLTAWNDTKDNFTLDMIPISHSLRDQLLEFLLPYNKRLYELTGRRCDW